MLAVVLALLSCCLRRLLMHKNANDSLFESEKNNYGLNQGQKRAIV